MKDLVLVRCRDPRTGLLVSSQTKSLNALGNGNRTFSEGELQGKRNLTMERRHAMTRMLGMKHGEDQRAKPIHGNREE